MAEHPKPLKLTHWSGIDVQDFSLSSLVDYNKSDKKERVFEVSLFAETLSEMFQRHFALLILKALIEADGESEVRGVWGEENGGFQDGKWETSINNLI